MSDDDGERLIDFVTTHTRVVLAIALVSTLVVSVGVADLDRETSLETFQSDGVEAETLDYLSQEYGLAAPDQSVGFVFYRDDDVLSKSSYLRVLRYQRALVENETVSRALVEGRATASTATLVATAAIRAEADASGDAGYFDRPTLAEQIDQIESMSPAEVDRTTSRVLAADAPRRSLFYQPTDYEAGSTDENATMVLVFGTGETGQVSGAASDDLVASQLAMKSIAKERLGADSLSFGSGLVKDELSRSVNDSLQLLVPFVLAFVVGVLALAYRDLFDLALSLVGLATVLLWTLGFMGWMGISLIQLYVPVIIFLVGLGIDFGIHVVMRHRETSDGDDRRRAMRTALGGVGLALVMVAVTTAIGFLSNGISDVAAIRTFGLIAAWGVTAALLVFGAFVPALKLELEAALDRDVGGGRSAFGTAGAVSRALSGGADLARRAPVAVVIVAVLLAGAGGAAGATIDTTFEQTAFMAQDPPEWTDSLPGPMATGEYEVRDTLRYTNERFIRHDLQTQILIDGNVTRDDSLERLHDARQRVNARESTYYLANGEPATSSALSVMDQAAAANESFNATVQAADTDGNGIPDRNVERVLDEMFEIRPALSSNVVHREDGTYTDMRLTISLVGGTSSSQAAAEARATARSLDGNGFETTATGRPVLFEIIQQELSATIVEAMSITFGLIVAILAVIYRRQYGSATLGLVAAVPVTLSLGWLVGTMWLLGLSFNALTALITSISVGLGVDYAIHMADRYADELAARGRVTGAMEASVRGTGGALLGSAVTTAGGFGVLVFAIVPPIAQFGFVSALSILYAFLATVLVLPSLLVLWSRYARPDAIGGDATAFAAATDDDD
ncbi:RND family transporter [Halorubrum sp. Atlit-28R]|jgi:predicted RND superfamily exporter protein|uniref:efflux RND transporter permease subunit n=1 Tax=Halorubrum sp. Atlit-28R TaxID=2282129 RepID=UPI000EF276A6|nr:MMPL family transporter [Halorubrum sp. Atlit-28R]RLM51145.1 RND family transporter [Halorubrum sp. Atlit-28R]